MKNNKTLSEFKHSLEKNESIEKLLNGSTNHSRCVIDSELVLSFWLDRVNKTGILVEPKF